MLKTAKNVFIRMIQNNTLQNYLVPPYDGYRIVVCGHSLGAGVAAIVAYLLRKEGYSKTHAYAYEPAGGLLNLAASTLFDDFCTSVVTGDDIVPRLSRHCMDLLKFDMKRLLHTCDLAKHQILNSVLFHAFSGPSEKVIFI